MHLKTIYKTYQLQHYTKFFIIGDINQLDQYSEKIGGTAIICGWMDIVACKFDLHLQDTPFAGPRFTWSNNRENEDLIMERLDHSYASQEWMNEYPQTHIRNLPIIHSDHGPILLYSSSTTQSAWRPYQIENWCLHHDEVRMIV